MAVTPVGQNRPQAPAQFEATNAAAQKSGAGEAVATARATATAGGQENAVKAELARDAFDPTAANQADRAQALGGADQAQNDQDVFTQALNSLVQALTQVVELVKSFLPPESATAQDPAQGIAPGEPTPGTDPLDGRGGGPGGVDRNPLGIPGPGGPGTQDGSFGVPGINQNDPNLDGENGKYKFGQTNCAPTALAEIARGKSLEDPNYSLTFKDANGVEQTKRVVDMDNEELVSTLGEIAKTDNLGTSPNGAIDAAAAMGLDVTNAEVQFDPAFEPGKPSHSFDQNWLDDKLNNGEKVVVNGAYEGKDEKGKDALIGHFMTIAGKNGDGTYAVMDPWDGKQKNLTADQLGRFMQANEVNGGVMLAIGDTPAERAQRNGQVQG